VILLVVLYCSALPVYNCDIQIKVRIFIPFVDLYYVLQISLV
jgi:hypothetical protein